ncbi:STAS domain-containing protein [Amycolatopsis sp. K13G38]|uniref:Anti-sigma factor antagonist n=1 Tax=Amycolatopsis acididurans TaxID=2724524 RepID=A0ABX1J8I1_9PSEU|nr:STAS domain-containing protein [Amycolatopsis acididurans]NKQ54607.1 STAS domain-containing protein [Amycolatopsis acididurans]
MTAARVEADVRGDMVCIQVSGEIDLANASLVQEKINAAITNEVRTVVIDMTGLEYLDSAGLRVLFTLADRLRVLQMTLELLVPPNSPVRKAVELSGLEPLARLRPGQRGR